MTVGGSFEYQEFVSGSETFEVRVIPGTALTQGRPFVMWDDIKDVFPLASRLQCGRRIISFMVDENGNRLLPLRIEYQPESVIQVILSRASSLQNPDDFPSPPPSTRSAHSASVSKHGSYIAAFTLEPAEENDRSPRDSLLSTWSISDEAKNRYRSSVYLYENFMQSIQLGRTNLASMYQDDFREQFYTLEGEMSRNQALQQQMMEMQQSMLELQQQAIDKLTAIQTRVQAILVQSYALLEYPIPRLFIILPKHGGQWDSVNILHNEFRVHFLCECGEHTKSIQGTKIPHHIHLAKHEGYDIDDPEEFFKYYGSYLLTLLHMIKYGVAVAGFTVPALTPSEPEDDKFSTRNRPYTFESGVDMAMEFLECMSSKGMFEQLPLAPGIIPNFASPRPSFQYSHEISINGGGSTISHPTSPQISREIALPSRFSMVESEFSFNDRASSIHSNDIPYSRNSMHSQEPLLPNGPALQFSQGNAAYARLSPQLLRELGLLSNTDLQQLGLYLKIMDPNQLLGDLYRYMTRDGTARWICEDHYREAYGVMAIKELTQVISVNDGKYHEHLGRVEVALSSSTIANLFYKLMERGKLIQDLKVTLKWDVSMSDVKALRDAISRSDIACLDLTCKPSTSTSDYLNRNKRADPLWEIIMKTRLQSFLLSDYPGFFSKVTVPIRTNNLRVLRVSERINWKKEGPRVTGLIGSSPRLKELRLSCLDMEDAFTAIKKVNLHESCSLEQLVIDGFESNKLVARFENGVPVTFDLIINNTTSRFLKEIECFRSLHLRLDLLLRVELDPHFLMNILSRNPKLVKLAIQCQAQEFLWWLTIVKSAMAEEGSCSLTSLRLYGGKNQLYIPDLQDENTVDLQLMTINMPREASEALLKLYGTKLSKLRIEGEVLKQYFEVALHVEKLALRAVDIKSSSLSADMLYDLRLILRRCQSTLKTMSIVLDVRWDGSERSNDLADFVSEFGTEWIKISINETDAPLWKRALSQRGFAMSPKILHIIPTYVKPKTPNLVEVQAFEN
ncbi:hypothetical protein BX616_004238 [Lobosporangium transversale]|uniref:Uncharacterized protein n=1 Tax=Lobosporangium transversale TaxID=64571 RepID=A0A1Y2G856_9FUNG|nr:hypothetical protein BCR41DRAFT_426164 [Lobosporangium transversale]KAF9898291.1 hypothetical protein BX616_004238 [Lobosporangium transversale]ORZ02074.1 hypothetical protein BCR41DRAFT_426164 [Lobosporangium transversale]|eukprot:XP_021876302.1 hypothetical protein BCR41DRAFT_426164 [Lobosporangium transversale]